jgi:hypothetical protein
MVLEKNMINLRLSIAVAAVACLSFGCKNQAEEDLSKAMAKPPPANERATLQKLVDNPPPGETKLQVMKRALIRH